jgi:hypothetical protein
MKSNFQYPVILAIEIVPISSHYNNLRSILKKYQWAKLRKIVIPPLNNKCCICGGKSPNRQLDLHEVWEYNNQTQIQKLVTLQGLCIYCHEVKHYYLANIKGNYNRARNRLMRINQWNDEICNLYEEYIHSEFLKRNEIEWKLDISLIDKYDI